MPDHEPEHENANRRENRQAGTHTVHSMATVVSRRIGRPPSRSELFCVTEAGQLPAPWLASLARGASFGATAKVWNIFAEGSGQINLMGLLLHQNLANLFCHRVFSKRFALPDTIAVIANGVVFIIEIEPQHFF